MSKSLRSDATPMLRGAIFQLCVALECCFKLRPAQVIYIEQLGDVTIPGAMQMEVKLYSKALTDGHPNFWNTLFNWTEPALDVCQFRFLILLTSQKFGTKSRLAEFNGLLAEQRMEMLDAIHNDLEQEFNRRNNDGRGVPSKTLLQQRELLKGTRREILKDVIGRIAIEARCPSPTDLYTQLCQQQARQVLDSKQEAYIDALFGFVCRRGMDGNRHWTISCEEFNKEVRELSAIYGSESRIFPRAEFDKIDWIDMEESRQDLFVTKIKDIGADSSHVKKAIRDYEGATATIDKEFRNHTSSSLHLKHFKSDVVGLFEASHQAACYRVVHDEHTSIRFYLETICSAPPTFPGYADSPANFRNGILHIEMDEITRGLDWKVVKK